jgi:hypothetical protein
MGKCHTFEECREQAKIRGYMAVAGILAVILIAGTSPIWLSYVPGNPPITSGMGTGQSVLYKGYVNMPGGGYPQYGTVSFIDATGYSWGSGSITAASAGSFTTGVIPTGATWWEYFNGTSIYWPDNWAVTIGEVKGQSQPANYYVTVPTQTVYQIATGYADYLIDNTYGGLSGATRTNSGSAAMANDSSIVKNIPVSFTYGITVSSTFSARLAQYMNPTYPASGGVQGYAMIVTNSSNAYLGPGSPGYSYRIGSANTVFVIPLPMVISGSTPATGTTTFSLIFPTAQHPTVYAYTVWNTNWNQLQSANGLTATAPLGYTVGTFQLLGNKDASHTYCLWTVT